jgi:hypothetical protein
MLLPRCLRASKTVKEVRYGKHGAGRAVRYIDSPNSFTLSALSVSWFSIIIRRALEPGHGVSVLEPLTGVGLACMLPEGWKRAEGFRKPVRVRHGPATVTGELNREATAAELEPEAPDETAERLRERAPGVRRLVFRS